MYQKRMAEIEARKAEIAKEIAQADEARTQELDAEVDGLNQELTMLRAKQAVAGKVKPLPDGGKPVDADLEARAAEMKNSGKIHGHFILSRRRRQRPPHSIFAAG